MAATTSCKVWDRAIEERRTGTERAMIWLYIWSVLLGGSGLMVGVLALESIKYGVLLLLAGYVLCSLNYYRMIKVVDKQFAESIGEESERS